MIATTVTYFEVSPETVFDGKYGHMVKIAYKFELDDELINSDIVKYFDFIEDIVFRLEWKKIISANENLLISERELPVYPTKRFMLNRDNVIAHVPWASMGSRAAGIGRIFGSTTALGCDSRVA